ncbi:phosphoadenosine phosphosulfate reductase family protein [Mucilaginibacter glaciei]|uniref:Phosphoadenosine phosphosulfate reductase family protein n=1 Tax=Mucilaginibacter glaciei TaxID=2772109 RepID=A0A926NV32_9SPHI|nr:phosphoadenosine phosphosulfate reductase family protein [Mucilaginibacter glaciei]MBD1395240.1 phosphoadenosine phosphosulfate reductase family protein [Mucilaginibacter glaciei]
MENKQVRHVLGISGGKDSAALAIYMQSLYPGMAIEYYTCDTGKELDETYQLIRNLESRIGVTVHKLYAPTADKDNPFDYYHRLYGGFLPSSNARWCTQKLKIEPFEQYIGSTPVISYVGIRGDEDREGYISTKPNVQSIFPFRKNIWSEEVVSKALANDNIFNLNKLYKEFLPHNLYERAVDIIATPLSMRYDQQLKVKNLLDLGIKEFNHVVFELMKSTRLPIAQLHGFPLLDNEEILVREDIFRILRESGVGVPQYYEEIPYDVHGKKGIYNRSRSGCFFCFFQQKIEWVWLYEQNPAKFFLAMEYEKDGYTWNQNERLEELINPARIIQIKAEFLTKQTLAKQRQQSGKLIDILDAEEEGCAACFI